MRGSVAKRVRKVAKAIIENTDRSFDEGYIETNKTNYKSHPSFNIDLIGVATSLTKPGSGKSAYKIMKKIYKRSPNFIDKSKLSTIKLLPFHISSVKQ